MNMTYYDALRYADLGRLAREERVIKEETHRRNAWLFALDSAMLAGRSAQEALTHAEAVLAAYDARWR